MRHERRFRPAAPMIRCLMTTQEILDTFALLDEWEDRYRYIIELGRTLAPMAEGDRNEATKVRGCVSQLWLKTRMRADGAAGRNTRVQAPAASKNKEIVTCHRNPP